MRFKYLILLIFVLIPSAGWACIGTPEVQKEQTVPVDELIHRTNNIVLAKAIKANPIDEHTVQYNFEVQKIYKGNSESFFSLTSLPWEKKEEKAVFNNHNNSDFWYPSGGRTMNYSDCEIRPTFEVGENYLMFLDQPYHRKSFEKIIRINNKWYGKKDKWLEYVENKTK